MKKILLLGVMFFTILSCHDDEISSVSLDNVESIDFSTQLSVDAEDIDTIMKPEYFDFIGQAHNSGLDYLYDNAMAGTDMDDLLEEDVNESVINYFESVYAPTSALGQVNFGAEEEELVRRSVNAQSIFIEGEDYSHLSTIEKYYLDALNEIVLSNNRAAAKIVLIAELDEQIYASDINDNEKALLYMTNSVARHSLAYWDGSGRAKWEDFLTTADDQTVARGVDWEKVAIADIAGFLRGFPKGVVTGAVRGALVLGLASGGTGAIPGAIIGALGSGCVTGITSAVKASGVVVGAYLIYDWWNS